ncbi:hypothetical protein V1478_002406 [Vespula squamosa]|uniref:Uncharacterized protein n=1 Tax=Vespula squamosa TaxID=30214 RepID=A0ABD2BVR3_VESSQ
MLGNVIAFGAMLTSLKVKRSYSVYTRRVKSNEVFEEMLNRNKEGYYEHGFLANCYCPTKSQNYQ